MKTEPNDNAFAAYDTSDGLTKREHFAGLAMQGILSDHSFMQPNQGVDIAKYAVQCADALIAELNKTQP